MKKLILLIALIVPLVALTQEKFVMVQGDSASKPIPTGRFRTVKSIFTTIYSPEEYKGFCMQREMSSSVGSQEYKFWEDISYYRYVGVFKKKKEYKMWEIYNYRL
jgi:hypothetical protein